MKKMGNFNVCAPTHTSQAIFIVGDTLEEEDEGLLAHNVSCCY